jgi:hypothetical protein
MKVTYELDTVQDEYAYSAFKQSEQLLETLSEFEKWLRQRAKHEDLTEEAYHELSIVQDKLYDIIHENNVIFE